MAKKPVQRDEQPTVLIMAGGTGGHVFPALAVADYLRQRNFRVVWLGTQDGMEAQLVPKQGYEMEAIKFSGVRGKGLVRWALLPLSLLVAFAQSVRVIRRQRPHVVLGMGGYAAFPGGLMASLLGRPLVLHEQNSVAGLTNRVLSVVADRILEGFPKSFERKIANPIASLLKPNVEVRCVGNPVRSDIAELPAPEQRLPGRSGNLRLLVVGGSLGAQALNATVPAALRLIPFSQRPAVVHQSGAKQFDQLRAAYAEAEVSGELNAFIDDMAQAYGYSDLVICRAGALTVAELCAAGVASILVPFPYAVDDHQTTNARFLSDNGAAVLMPQQELTAERLAELVHSFTREKLLAMAQRARALAKPAATESVGQTCMELARAA